jgi:hypothetical protein
MKTQPMHVHTLMDNFQSYLRGRVICFSRVKKEEERIRWLWIVDQGKKNVGDVFLRTHSTQEG